MNIGILIRTLDSTILVSGDNFKKVTDSINLCIGEKCVLSLDIIKFRLEFFQSGIDSKFYNLVGR